MRQILTPLPEWNEEKTICCPSPQADGRPEGEGSENKAVLPAPSLPRRSNSKPLENVLLRIFPSAVQSSSVASDFPELTWIAWPVAPETGITQMLLDNSFATVTRDFPSRVALSPLS